MRNEVVRRGDATSGLRERNKQMRADRIVDAALTLLKESPGHSPTMEQVAARAEVSPMTVVNLIGNRDQLWTAMADRALSGLDWSTVDDSDPLQRAHAIVAAVVSVLRTEPSLFRSLLGGWSGGGRLLIHDPTAALIACLEDDARASRRTDRTTLRRHGEVMAAGLIGVIHQWTAGLIGDRALASRARSVVDIVFCAARAPVD